jgi:hypothetical protein
MIRAPHSLRDRTALLGVTPPASGRSSPFDESRSTSAGGHRFADDLEGQNDEMLQGLSAKVKLLKDVSEFCGKIKVGKDDRSFLFFLIIRSTSSGFFFRFPPSFYSCKDHGRYRERGAGLDDPAEPNGEPIAPIEMASHLYHLERCFRGDVRHPLWNLPADEQYGRATRLSLVVVHRFPHPRLLVLSRHVVVSAVTRNSSCE